MVQFASIIAAALAVATVHATCGDRPWLNVYAFPRKSIGDRKRDVASDYDCEGHYGNPVCDAGEHLEGVTTQGPYYLRGNWVCSTNVSS